MNIEKLGITPGPWEMCEHSWSDTSVYREGGEGKRICTDSLVDYATEENQSEMMKEQVSNMLLIASAPEMIEDEIVNIKLLKHLLSFPMLKDCVGQMTIDMIEGRLFTNEETTQKATGKTWEEIKHLLED